MINAEIDRMLTEEETEDHKMSRSTIFPRLVSLILLAVVIFQCLVMGNITRTGELVMLEGDDTCYTYLQFKAGHVLQNRETGALKLVYIKPIAVVQSCGKIDT